MLEAPMATIHSISTFSGNGIDDMFEELTTRRHRCLKMAENDDVNEEYEYDDDIQMDDHFRMYEFKVRRCVRCRSHDWTDCPYAHPGEKARRRDPTTFHYSSTPCPEFRKGSCRKGDTCEFSHGVFECWLHPSRYRTQPCKDGVFCHRRICFFAHTPEQIRILSPCNHVPTTQSPRYDASPSRLPMDSLFFATAGSFSCSSPTSTLYFPHSSSPTDSPPMSPVSSLGPNSVCDLAYSMRNLQIGKATRLSMGVMNGSTCCSPRIPYAVGPIIPSCSGPKAFEMLDEDNPMMMERVESGKGIRAQIYAKLSRDNAFSESCELAM